MPSHPHYPLPRRLALALFRDTLFLRSRSFQADSRACINLLNSPLQVISPEKIPSEGPALLVMNHYSRPGFQAYWIALGISATVPTEIHWLMTNTWTFLGPLEPITRWFFPRVAHVYGFTTTPPMPPNPRDMVERAFAVRRVLQVARSQRAIIALAPEGRDHPKGILGPPPPGVGRFIQQLAKYCQRITPIGVYEDEVGLCLNFGPAFELDPLPEDFSAKERDQFISQQVMHAIARQLPEKSRGEYKT